MERSSMEPLTIHHQIKFRVTGCVGVAGVQEPIKGQHVMLEMFWHLILLQIKQRVYNRTCVRILAQKCFEVIPDEVYPINAPITFDNKTDLNFFKKRFAGSLYPPCQESGKQLTVRLWLNRLLLIVAPNCWVLNLSFFA